MRLRTRAPEDSFARAGRRPLHPLAWLVPAAVVLRLVLFLGRGDYVAYDEAFYLLLGRNLWSGAGFTLSGLRHIALSPLFPILAGGVDRVLGDAVWAGRVVAAVTSGLLVLPCWSIFNRLAGRRTALLACILIAVLPSLAPYGSPFWVGWDLWVGAEPVLHLFLFCGIAFVLRGFERGRIRDWAAAGAAFGLAYLARPEAVIPFGLLGLAAAATLLVRRRLRGLASSVAFGAAFIIIALPYWIYLHDATGRWTLTGRGVQISLPTPRDEAGGGGGGPTKVIEGMLWQGRIAPYVRQLYALDASGVHLASDYWGVPVKTSAPAGNAERAVATPPDRPETSARDTARIDRARPDPPGAFQRLWFYVRALEIVVPWFLWPLVALGLLAPRRRNAATEWAVTGTLAATSFLIATVVAIDPRTQLFLAPVLVFYAARGIRLAGAHFDRRHPGALRRGFVGALLATTVGVVLFGDDVRQLYLGLAVGSAQQIAAAHNRRAADVLEDVIPRDEPIVSWHPALAVYARRDWRVRPRATFGETVRYAAANGYRYVVFSVIYPLPSAIERMPHEYMVVEVPSDLNTQADGRFRIEVTDIAENCAIGRLVAE
ncbi:MAG TPA: glycosyltransferase family 39 protein [Longimicrobiales bacterium]